MKTMSLYIFALLIPALLLGLTAVNEITIECEADEH